MRSTYNNHCPIKGQMKQRGEGVLFCLSVSITLSPEMSVSPFACKCNCHFPACQPPTGRTAALEGQPALSEKTLNTCDSLLSNQQQRGCRGRGGRRNRGAENRNNGEEQEGTTSSCFLSQQLWMWETKGGKLGNKGRRKEAERKRDV